ncbi:MAG: Glycosyl transferase, family 2 [Microgenomates group bacterium GW2011_GWB1_40_9]|nr:MAG: Glycosyl transferase, family 2 [Microgenomates group bacterium GW2011_GWC1_39_12]KKR79752.1 MAG: Glycosyl transferase, family 2 [Microgenomates group bacterium GW2011_GWB1_40_9]
MKKWSISIVIPNWNGVYLLQKHLQNAIDATDGCEMIVSDDCSTDESVDYLKKNFPRVIVVSSKNRQGFAGNVNAGVARATGDIVILLNTDVEPEKGFLQPLLSHFDDPNVFAVGCLEKSWENGQAVLRGRGIASWKKGFYVHERGEVDKKDTAWVSGGSGAFRRSMWNTLGGMDTIYNPFYWEDIDLSYRARKAEWKTIFESKSIVNHYHEEGKIKKEFNQIDVRRIVYRNQFIFIWKNVTDIKILLSHVFWTPIRLMQAILHNDLIMIRGFFWALMYIGPILQKRSYQKKLYKRTDNE